MNEWHRQIVSGLVAAGALAFLQLGIGYRFGFSVGIAAAIGVGMYFTLPRKKAPNEIEMAPGVTRADLDRALDFIGEHVVRLESLRKQVRDPLLSESIADMVQTLRNIARNFKDDPRDLGNAGPFINQYLARSTTLIEQYVRLASHAPDPMITERIARIGDTIGRVRNGFKEFYRQCIENDVTDLEIDSQTLKSLMDLELPESTADYLPGERSMQ